jgi:hypothetical protein
MMTTHLSTFATPDVSSERAPTLWRAENQDVLHESHFKQSEMSSCFAIALPTRDLFDETVEIFPIDSVKRHSTGRYGIVAESIYAPVRSRIQIRYNGPVHVLVLYENGARCEGETSIDGLPPSTLRKFANKLTFAITRHAVPCDNPREGTASRVGYFRPTHAAISDASTSRGLVCTIPARGR